MGTRIYSCIGLAISTAAGFALDPAELLLIQKGPVALKPQFELSEIFSDNITYRETDRQADFMTVVSPGLALQAGRLEYNYINVSYFFDRLQYLDHSELSANQHRAALDLSFTKTRFTLIGRDIFEHLETPLGGGISIGGAKIARDRFLDEYRLLFDMSAKTGLYLEALHSSTDYEEGFGLYDSLTLSGTAGFQYMAFSRTSFFGEVYYGKTENEPNLSVLPEYATATFVGGFAGARGQFTEKLSGTVKAGFEHRSYSDDGDSLNAPVVEVSLTERFSDRTVATIAYSRRQSESVQFVRSAYTLNSVSGNVTQQFGNEGRLRGVLQAGYYSASYEPNPAYGGEERLDQIVTGGLTLAYDIKLWLRAFGSYNAEYLDSNIPSIADYVVNRVTVGLQLGY